MIFISTKDKIENIHISESIFLNDAEYMTDIFNKKNCYLVNTGVCSCDFFWGRGKKSTFNRCQDLKKSLYDLLRDINDVYLIDRIFIYDSFALDNIQDVKKEGAAKIKIAFREVIENFDNLILNRIYSVAHEYYEYNKNYKE